MVLTEFIYITILLTAKLAEMQNLIHLVLQSTVVKVLTMFTQVTLLINGTLTIKDSVGTGGIYNLNYTTAVDNQSVLTVLSGTISGNGTYGVSVQA